MILEQDHFLRILQKQGVVIVELQDVEEALYESRSLAFYRSTYLKDLGKPGKSADLSKTPVLGIVLK